MERLTEKHYLAEDHYMKCSDTCHGDMDCIDCPAFDQLVERLAAYEDIAELCGGVDRLRELSEADKDGRLVVMPCKVGDKLYRVFAGEIFEHRVGTMKYFAIQGRWGIETYPFCPCVESSIGKTVFLTREEAEKAMEG